MITNSSDCFHCGRPHNKLLPLRQDYQQAVSLSGLSTSWLLPMTHQATSNDDEPLIRQLPLRLTTLRIVCKGGRTTSRTDDQLIRLLPLRQDYQQAVSLSGLATSWLLPMTHQATPNDDEPLIRQPPLRLVTLRIVCKGGRTTSRTDDQFIRLLPLRPDYQQAVS